MLTFLLWVVIVGVSIPLVFAVMFITFAIGVLLGAGLFYGVAWIWSKFV